MDFDFGDWENTSWEKKKTFESSIGECIEKEQWKTEEKDFPGSKNIAWTKAQR